MNEVLQLFVAYMKAHGQEIATTGLLELKKLIEERLSERHRAEASIKADQEQLAMFRHTVDEDLK